MLPVCRKASLWALHFGTGILSGTIIIPNHCILNFVRWNVFDTIHTWIDDGAPKEKLIMGITFYGRGFVLNDTDYNGLYCPAYAGIPAGPYTRQDAIWGYQEILQAKNNDTLINLPNAVAHAWVDTVDDCYRAPYMGILKSDAKKNLFKTFYRFFCIILYYDYLSATILQLYFFYIVNGPYWIGYDDPESIKIKTQYVNFLEIGRQDVKMRDRIIRYFE